MITIGVLVLVIGGVGVYALTNRDVAVIDSDAMVNIENTEGMEDTKAVMKNSKIGTYIPFSPEVLASSATTRRVLFFYASWCPTCIPADASFTNNVSQIPADVTLVRVNYNDTETDQEEKDLAKQYGVTYQHTFVQIDAKGNEITKWNGGQIDELLSNLK